LVSAALVARTEHVPAAPNVNVLVDELMLHDAVPAPPINAYVTPPVPDPPVVDNLNMFPKLTDVAFASDNAACAAWPTVIFTDCRVAGVYMSSPAWSARIVQVPTPRTDTTAPVTPAMSSASPETSHTVGVADEKVTGSCDVVDAVTRKSADVYVFDPPVYENAIVCEVRLIVNVLDVTGVKPGDENVTVKSPPARFTFIPLNVATPDDAVADAALNVACTDPDVLVAVITAELDVTVFPAESMTRTTGTVLSVVPASTPPTG
jgi:hypothetical protein